MILGRFTTSTATGGIQDGDNNDENAHIGRFTTQQQRGDIILSATYCIVILDDREIPFLVPNINCV